MNPLLWLSKAAPERMGNVLMAGDDEMADPMAYDRWRRLLEQRWAAGPEGGQEKLGPLEHGAFAESFVREHPLLGPASMLAAIPAYDAAKATGLVEGWTPASVDSLAEGYRGVGRGVAANIGDLLAALSGTRPPAVRPPENYRMRHRR